MQVNDGAYSEVSTTVAYMSGNTPQLYIERPAQNLRITFTVVASGNVRYGSVTTDAFDVAVLTPQPSWPDPSTLPKP